jgi:mannose-6-phosphate isomerase-like protein (cupin superfamily)
MVWASGRERDWELFAAEPAANGLRIRAHGSAPPAAVADTMPPWPGEKEASVVEGRWESTAR